MSLDNLARELVGDEYDASRVAAFVEAVLAATAPGEIHPENLTWWLESSQYEARADFSSTVSPQLDSVLVHASDDGSLVEWLTRDRSATIGLDAAAASQRAWRNLDRALSEARIVVQFLEGLPMVTFEASFPSKASLLLAPSLREVVEGIVGWPVLAVAPDRDFVLMWNATRRDLVSRFSSTVLREYQSAPHPLSTDVLRIGDSVRSIGSFVDESSRGPA